MNGNEIYDIICEFMPNAYYIKKNTTDWCDDERINSYWCWAMENLDKYDPERGNLEQWLKGSVRRTIDIYRREKGSRYKREWQYPETPDGISDSESCTPYEGMIPDHREKGIEYDVDRWNKVEKSLDLLSTDSRMILESAVKIDKRNSNGAEEALAESLGISKISMQSRRTLAKNTVRKHVLDLEFNERNSNGNGC